jgi:type IV fimbrial biogenesis protein FimT
MRKDAPGRATGFSLVEVSIVLALAAILAGLALPGFRDLLQRQRVNAAMHQLSTQLAQARITAISRRTPVTLCPSLGDGRCRGEPDWSAGWLVYRDPARASQPQSPGDILQDIRDPVHGSLRILSSSGRLRVRYQPDGFSSGTNLTVRICVDASLQGEIVVNNAGRARIRRAAKATPCPDS